MSQNLVFCLNVDYHLLPRRIRMLIRSFKDRAVQTLLFEFTAGLIFTPITISLLGLPATDSIKLVVILSVVAVAFTGFFNTCFDAIEFRWLGRVSSDRRLKGRLIHTTMLELSMAAITVPIIKASLSREDSALAGSWLNAIIVDFGFVAVAMLYGYVFFYIYDKVRPVQRRGHPMASLPLAIAPPHRPKKTRSSSKNSRKKRYHYR